MAAQPWRERREAYLRERGRLADMIRDGYIQSGLAVIKSGCRRVPPNHPALIVITTPPEERPWVKSTL